MPSARNYWEILFENFPWLGYFLWKFSFLQWPCDPADLCDSKNQYPAFLLASKQMSNKQLQELWVKLWPQYKDDYFQIHWKKEIVFKT